MSGFLLTEDTQVSPGRIEMLRARPRSWFSPLDWGSCSGVETRVDDQSLWAKAHDPDSGKSVVVAGRLSLSASDWALSGKLPYAGGRAASLVLQHWLQKPDCLYELLDGPFCILMNDPARGELHVITDRMGAYPVYAPDTGKFCLSSHPDVLAGVLADDRQHALDMDMSTMAECLLTGGSVTPYTYYEGIRQLDAARHYTYKPRYSALPSAVSTYWLPITSSREIASLSLNECAEAFAGALRSAGARRGVSPMENPALLLSGGADSRALLFTAASPQHVQTLTFCDAENPELLTARQLADSVAARHETLVRNPEHYVHGAWETVRITGGMWSIKDAHYHGFINKLEETGCTNLMTGCYTDYLFKGLAYNRRALTLAGKTMPVERLGEFGFDFYQPHQPIAEKWRDRVMQRLESRFPETSRRNNETARREAGDLRVRPLAREADAMGRLYLMRALPWDPVMLDNALLAFYVGMSERHKLNGIVFRKAVARLSPRRASKVLNNNDQAPLAAGDWQRIRHYLVHKLLSRVGVMTGMTKTLPALATTGSWPDFSYFIAHSEGLRAIWMSCSLGQREILSELLGYDPWKRSMQEWAKGNVDLFLRLVTLKIWLQQRGY